MTLAPARFSRVSLAGRAQSVQQSVGDSYLFDMSSRIEVSLDCAFDNVRIHIPQRTIDQMSYEKGIRGIGGFHCKEFGKQDPVLLNLTHAILPAIDNSYPVTTAFVEYLGLATFDHLIYIYGGAARKTRSSSRLSPWQIRRACDFIEENLAADPSIMEMAATCGITESYFIRAFKGSLGMTPHRWIIQRRISRAKSMLQNSKLAIADIAVVCGFADQSHLGRYFRLVTCHIPAEWRRLYYNSIE